MLRFVLVLLSVLLLSVSARCAVTAPVVTWSSSTINGAVNSAPNGFTIVGTNAMYYDVSIKATPGKTYKFRYVTTKLSSCASSVGQVVSDSSTFGRSGEGGNFQIPSNGIYTFTSSALPFPGIGASAMSNQTVAISSGNVVSSQWRQDLILVDVATNQDVAVEYFTIGGYIFNYVPGSSTASVSAITHATFSFDLVTPTPTPTPNPSPTPVPTPTPGQNTIDGKVTDINATGDGIQGKALQLDIDYDGDNVSDKTVVLAANPDGTFEFANLPVLTAGSTYQISLTGKRMTAHGDSAPVIIPLYRGEITTEGPQSLGDLTYNVTDTPQGYVKVGSGGEVIKETVQRYETSYTPPAPGSTPIVSYQYSYTSAGKSTTVSYSSNGEGGLTQNDIREAAVQNAAGQDKIVDAIKDQTEALVSAMGSPSPSPTPTPGPSVTPSPTPGNATPDDVLAAAAAKLAEIPTGEDEITGLQAAGAPSGSERIASGGGSWPFVIAGQTVDLNPMANPEFGASAPWCRNLLVLISTSVVIFAAYKFLFTFEGYSSLQPFGTTLGFKANIEAVLAAALATWGVAGLVLVIVVWVVFFGICALVVSTALALLISMPSIVSGTLSFSQYGAPSFFSGFAVGGSGIFTAIWEHLKTAPLWIMRFVWLLDQFVPIAHFLVVAANLLTMNAWGTFILRVIALIKRLIPS